MGKFRGTKGVGVKGKSGRKTKKEEIAKAVEAIKKQTIEELAESKLYKHLKSHVKVGDRQGLKEIALPVYLKSKAEKLDVNTNVTIEFDEAFNPASKTKGNSKKSKKVESDKSG